MNNHSGHLIDPNLSITLIYWLSWIMVGLGALKLMIFAVGALKPSVYDVIKSDSFRKFFVGTGNRFIFGWLGFATLLFGLFGLLCGFLLARAFGI